VLFAKAKRIQKPRPLEFFRESIQWVETARYLGVPAGLAVHVSQVRRKVAQRLGILGPLLNRRSGLSIRKGVLLYQQLISPVMDYECPIWRSAARSHVRKLQVCLRIATKAPWCLSNRQIHYDLGIPFSPTTSQHELRASTKVS
jgi:hypothetical protein